MRLAWYVLAIAVIFCAACGTIVEPEVVPRAVRITLLPAIEQTQLPPLPAIVEVVARRTGEVMCVKTQQSHYWEDGDTVETAQPHPQQIVVDNQYVFSGENLFVFWSNANTTSVEDTQGNISGAFLTAPMYLCFSTSALPHGSHTGVAEITSTLGIVYSHHWDFVIESIERFSTSSEIAATAEYLAYHPTSIPDFVTHLGDAPTTYLDGARSYEGLCATVNLELGDIRFLLDGQAVPEGDFFIRPQEISGYFICADVYQLAYGIHLATIESISDPALSHSWMFYIH